MVTASSPLPLQHLYHVPTYTIADTARYLHIPLPTLRTWVNGRSYPTKKGHKEFLPLIQRPNPDIPQLSFTNLVEAHVLRVIRTVHNVPLDKIRIALDYISEQFKTDHPLVLKQFSTDGVDLFIEQVEQLINASRSGQLAMKQVLNHLLTRIEWDEKDIAARLFPTVANNGENFTDKVLIIDPNVSFGKPTITGTGIPTKIVTELFDAGDLIEDIADDYNCTPWQIEKAILFESNLQAA
ncbi:MAG: DUF433 domain-containing protein [Microcystaceae cyanobacterium]